ncbi:CD209 antigen-like protein D [Saccostrea echinata]|uniref:CD209 antigen-like protein D n=1 Tax=Saccostrea echinata TaxID=191078 RepID=UPI002A826E86|nr:CD209 antigen-like protein D [Saccostrea echinata]
MNNSLEWQDAKDSCISMGAHLLAIETEAEQIWIQNEISASGNAWWMGGTDAKSEGTFYWEHSNNTLNFTNWYNGEPNGGTGENCLEMFSGGDWNDKSCNSFLFYICEK